jgi:hypothetical protein
MLRAFGSNSYESVWQTPALVMIEKAACDTFEHYFDARTTNG